MVHLVKTEKAVVFSESSEISDVILCQIEDRMLEKKADGLILGQFPYYDLGFIDPLTAQCFVPNSNAFAVSRKCYERIGEADIRLRSACAADYVLRMEIRGMRIALALDIVLPVTDHVSITESWVDSLLLQYKYAIKDKRRDILKKLFNHLLVYDSAIGNYSRNELIREIPAILAYMLFGNSEPSEALYSKAVNYYQYANIRGVYKASGNRLNETPMVSLVLRTHRRPEVLRSTLQNIRFLNYPNYEIVLIEDGDELSRGMIEKEFADLNLRYYATKDNVGRAAAANIGFRMCKGEWINLIDDDDFFFPEHLRIGLEKALSENVDMVFLQSVALDIISQNKPYSFTVKRMHHIAAPRIDPFTMSTECKTSDNGVLFRKDVLEKAGGMREDLEAHEDWSLWLRMMAIGTWATVPYATCMFVNPADEQEKNDRINRYSVSDGKQFDDKRLKYSATSDEIRSYFYGSVCDFEALLVEGALEVYLDKYLSRYRLYSDDHMSKAFDEWEKILKQRKGGVYTARQFHEWYCGMAYRLKRTEPELRQQMLTKWKEVSSSLELPLGFHAS